MIAHAVVNDQTTIESETKHGMCNKLTERTARTVVPMMAHTVADSQTTKEIEIRCKAEQAKSYCMSSQSNMGKVTCVIQQAMTCARHVHQCMYPTNPTHVLTSLHGQVYAIQHARTCQRDRSPEYL